VTKCQDGEEIENTAYSRI